MKHRKPFPVTRTSTITRANIERAKEDLFGTVKEITPDLVCRHLLPTYRTQRHLERTWRLMRPTKGQLLFEIARKAHA